MNAPSASGEVTEISNEVEIVVTSSDRSAAGIASANRRVDELRNNAIKKIEEINAKEIRLKADISQAEAKLADLKRKAESASGDAKVKVDADVASAEAKLADLKRQLANIPDARAKVDADTNSAIAKLRDVDTQSRNAARDKAFKVTADTSGALAAIAALLAAVGAIGPVAIAITGTLAGVGAGVGVGAGAAIAGFTGIGDAVKAMGEKATGGGGAVAASASQIRSATRAVEDAERSLASAQDDAKAAQADLTDARREAADQLEELKWQTQEMALSEEGAAISVERAKERLQELDKDGKASALDYREARHRVAEAEFRAGEVSRQSTKLAGERNEAERKGVEGSDQVVAAKKKIQQTEEQVRVATERLADSQLALAEAMKPKGGGGGQVDKLAEALEKLGPNAREFATFLRGFVDKDLGDLRKAGQEAFLPGVQKGLESLRPMITQLTPAWTEFSRVTGDAMGGFITALGQMAPSVLDFASVTLQGLSPLKGEFQDFSAQFGAMVQRVTDTGVARDAMGQFAAIIGQLLSVIPPLIEYGLKLMTAMGPDLQQSFSNIGEAATTLGDAFLEFAPTAGDLLVNVTGLLNPLAELLGWLLNLNPQATAAFIAVAGGVAVFIKLQTAAKSVVAVLGELGLGFGKAKAGADDVEKSTGRAEAGMRRLGLALVAAQLASAAFGSSASEGATVAANALEKYGESGEATSEILKNLGYDFDTLADNTWYDKAGLGVAGFTEAITGLGSVFDNSLQHAGERLSSIDQGLSQLVQGGKADEAARAFQRLAEQAAAQGISVERLAEEFPAYREALAQAAQATGDAANAQGRYNDALKLSSSQILGQRSAETQYYEALARTKEALQENGATLSVHTQRGRDNRTALDQQAQAANRLLESILANEGAGPKFTSTLTQSRAALSQTAQSFGMGKKAADDLAAAVISVPASKNVKITADTASAMSNVNGLKTAIATINGKTVTIRTVQETVYISSGGSTVIAKSAGGRIPGPASRVDSIPAILAQGEYVVNSGATSQWLPLLEQINSGSPVSSQALRSMGVPGMSDAGPGGGGGGSRVVLELHSSGSAMDDFLVDLLRRAVRTRGGDVQVVLGQGAAA